MSELRERMQAITAAIGEAEAAKDEGRIQELLEEQQRNVAELRRELAKGDGDHGEPEDGSSDGQPERPVRAARG